MTWLVFLCTAAVTIAIYVSVPTSARLSKALARIATRIARKAFVAELIVFLFAFALSATPSVIWSVPLPSEPDEFSYLLAADTFARARLTNPAHPMAGVLEYADVIQRPTYASKHPPAQGAVLALGLKIANLPILGVWIISALACASITWMLRAVGPSRFALLGGLLVSMHPLIGSWTQSYWGGSVAMLGGALALGAVLRMTNRASRRDALVAGLGFSILALSRPFEGALFALILAILSARRLRFRNPVFIALPLIPTLLFLGYYNSRITGDWKLFPHRLHQQQYMITPRFFWEPARPDLHFNSPIMRDFAKFEFGEYQNHLGARNYVRMLATKVWRLIDAHFPPAMLLLAIVGATQWRRWPVRLAFALVLLLPAIHLTMIPITRMPYFAPILGAILILVISALRSLPAWVAAIAITTQIAAWIHTTPAPAEVAHSGPAVRQAHEVERLLKIPGKHLVLVRYETSRPPLYDFVHNGADIDAARIVFARSIDEQRDRATKEYFDDRRHWLLVQDDKTLTLQLLHGAP